MARRVNTPAPPAGWRRLLVRAPIRLYHWHLGPLLGRRLCLLTHTGRSSGLPRETALEVTGGNPVTGAVHLASGFGPTAQWYRNIQHTPQVFLQIGGHRQAAVARPMSPQESGLAMATYAPKHPRAARQLMRICGIATDGSTEDYYRVGRDLIPFVEVSPCQEQHEQ